MQIIWLLDFTAKKKITYDDWIESTAWLAEKYKNDDTVIAYDLKNEPHGKRGYSGSSCPTDMAKWDDSTDQKQLGIRRYRMRQCNSGQESQCF